MYFDSLILKDSILLAFIIKRTNELATRVKRKGESMFC